MQEHVKTAVDAVSFGVAASTVMQWLPAVAALFSIIWTSIRIFEWAKRRGKK